MITDFTWTRYDGTCNKREAITSMMIKKRGNETMKKKVPKKNSIDGANLPDSRLVELLDRCIISVKDIKCKKKKKDKNGTES